MQPHKRAHALHINKTALFAQNINLRLQLDALGMQINLSVTVDNTINDWFCFFYNSWFDFSKLTILSFHSVKGNIVSNTSEVANPAVLLPVQDGGLTDNNTKDVKFIHVQLTIDYSTFVNVNPAGPTILRAEYYIELPQTLRQLLNVTGTTYNLFIDGPIDFWPARFNLSSAKTDSNKLRLDIRAKILRLAFSTVCNTLFLKL
jgi:hypothetical protein